MYIANHESEHFEGQLGEGQDRIAAAASSGYQHDLDIPSRVLLPASDLWNRITQKKRIEMSVDLVRTVLNTNNSEISFLIGNGINRHYNSGASSWEQLLIELWRDHSFSTQSVVPPGISFTEFYDALELEGYGEKKRSTRIRRDIAEKLRTWNVNKDQNLILDRIKNLDAPILTLNFDDLIPRSLALEKFQLRHFNSNDFYPWDRYYSDRRLKTATNGFGVWYINGMVAHQRSIKLGLSHYMGNVNKARPLLQKAISKGRSFIAPHSAIANSWLSILLQRNLFIFGAGLDEDEVFLRWLLIQRAKYFRRHPSQRRHGWYVTAAEGTSVNDQGKEFFLRSVGIDVLTVPTYEKLYEDVWRSDK